MKRLILLFSLVVTMLSACTTNYYLVVADSETPVYSELHGDQAATSIPPNKGFVVNRKLATRSKVQYGGVTGYGLHLTSWRELAKLNKKQYRELTFSDIYGYTYGGVSTESYATPRTKATASPSTYSGGTVHVKGYTRKDGTYVKPHTRSAPRRH